MKFSPLGRFTPSFVGAGFALGFSLFISPLVSRADIIAYYEVDGSYVEAWGSSGNLAGGYFDGRNIADISASEFFGAENNTLRLIGPDGIDYHYYIWPGGGDNSLYAQGTTTTLTNGALDGEILKNPYWLGATNDVNYYVKETGGVIRYLDAGNHALHLDLSLFWTTFTNGELNGQSPAPGMGLTDFAGGNAMNENLFVIVNSQDGTMDYYNLDNGLHSPGHDATYGSWATFSGGLLDGLTLAYLQANPEGTHNGIAYRFLGTSQEGMYFDIGNAVPEPSTALLAGLAGVAPLLSRGRARKNQKAA